MKKTFIILLSVCLLIPMVSFAQQKQQGIHEPGTGIENSEIMVENVSTQNMNGNGNQNGSGAGQKAQQGIHEPGTGLEEPVLYQGSGQGASQGQQNQNQNQVQENTDTNPMGEVRRNRVANAVQEMLKVATRNGGVGTQIRTIAQTQNQIQEEAENALQKAKKRSSFARFFVGPNYREIKTVEQRLEQHTQNLEELQTLKDSLTSSYDKNLLEEQIQVMEEVKTELEAEVKQDTQGFSLFGWLNKILTR